MAYYPPLTITKDSRDRLFSQLTFDTSSHDFICLYIDTRGRSRLYSRHGKQDTGTSVSLRKPLPPSTSRNFGLHHARAISSE